MIIWFVGVIDIILVSIFYENFFFHFKKFNERDQSTSIFKKSQTNCNLKKLKEQLDIFEQKDKPKE